MKNAKSGSELLRMDRLFNNRKMDKALRSWFSNQDDPNCAEAQL